MSLVAGVARMALMGLVRLVLLALVLMRLLSLVALLAMVSRQRMGRVAGMLMLLLLLLLVLALLLVALVTRVLLRMMRLLLMRLLLVLLLLVVREDWVVLNRLANGARKEHGRRVWYLLARGSTALALGGETVGDVRIRRARGPIGDIAVHLSLAEDVLVCALLRLLRRVGMRLVWRSSMGCRRLLIWLVRVRWRKAGAATEASL